MQKLHIGSINILNFTNLPDGRTNLVLAVNDPIRVKKEIGLNEVSKNLFSTINSGVRFWPFLLVARDLDNTNSKQKILKRLRNIQRKQPKKLGPEALSTFFYYRSMYRRLKEMNDPDSEDLRNLIEDRRRNYYGDFEIFRRNRNTNKWKMALVKSMGLPGRQFAGLLNKLRDKDETENIVEEAITKILKNKSGYDEWLWKGAFSYAFLHCMYGINETEVDGNKVVSHYKASEWADILVRVLSNPNTNVPDLLRNYIPLIKRSKNTPPWRKKAESLKEQNRIVLSYLRFYTFYYLYIKPIPKGY